MKTQGGNRGLGQPILTVCTYQLCYPAVGGITSWGCLECCSRQSSPSA